MELAERSIGALGFRCTDNVERTTQGETFVGECRFNNSCRTDHDVTNAGAVLGMHFWHTSTSAKEGGLEWQVRDIKSPCRRNPLKFFSLLPSNLNPHVPFARPARCTPVECSSIVPSPSSRLSLLPTAAPSSAATPRACATLARYSAART